MQRKYFVPVFLAFDGIYSTGAEYRAWILDLIALGPHREWVEPSVIEESFDYDSVSSPSTEVGIAIRRLLTTASGPEKLYQACWLYGREPSDDTCIAVLEVLYARSLDSIAQAMTRGGFRYEIDLLRRIDLDLSRRVLLEILPPAPDELTIATTARRGLVLGAYGFTVPSIIVAAFERELVRRRDLGAATDRIVDEIRRILLE